MAPTYHTQIKDETVPIDHQNLSYQTHRRIIGCLGLLLPPLLYLLAGLRHTKGLEPWELLNSLSAYYYTGAVAVFVGVLFALSLFLFTYPGYKGISADRIVGMVGGLAALGVALFPTTAPDGVLAPAWWRDATRTIHYASAVILFGAFILFSLWLFRKSDKPNPSDRSPGKKLRNVVYLVCGCIMIGCMIWAGSSHFTGSPIFWPEAIALWAFAISWLVKGEVYAPIVRKAQSIWQTNKR